MPWIADTSEGAVGAVRTRGSRAASAGTCLARSLRPGSALAAGLGSVLCCLSPTPAAAIPEGQWATQLIEKMGAEEGGVRHRAPLRLRGEDLDDDERAATRRTRRAARAGGSLERSARSEAGRRLASLTREIPRLATPPLASAGPEPKAAEPRAGEPPRVASLGPPVVAPAKPADLGGGVIRWVASADCLAAPLRRVLAEVAQQFGPLRVNSTCRSKRHNARVGGAPRSYHLTGNAVDFRVESHAQAVHAFLRTHRAVGGLKHYGSGVFHIDTGPRRTWASRRDAWPRLVRAAR